MHKIHTSVLLKELRDLSDLKEGDVAIDGTLDGGGHAEMLLEKVGKSGKVLGIERDPEMRELIENEKSEKGWNNLLVVGGSYGDVKKLLEKHAIIDPKLVLLDLGVSAWHFKKSGRGFSFEKKDEPLYMSFEINGKSAAELVNMAPQEDLAKIFEEFGELKTARRLAKNVVLFRKHKRILTVGDFTDAISGGKKFTNKVLAMIFQALRIAVNDELKVLESGLRNSFDVLSREGRLAVISFHSLEDRIVKNYFRELVKNKRAEFLNKKPITPSKEEIMSNPSSRSAKLRVIKKK